MNTEDEQIQYDSVNNPRHYNLSKAKCTCGRRLQPIDISTHMNFNLGNVIKYIWRQEHKGKIEDLQKAIWFLNCEIRRLQIK
jgi:hypothetical protein